MKTNKFFLYVTGILMSSLAFSDESNPKLINEQNDNPNYISFGFEFFWFHINTDVQNIKVDGTKFLSGPRIDYEYLKPKAFYAGANLFAAIDGDNNFRATFKGCHLPNRDSSSTFGIANLEARFGYTFAPKRWLISPFLGVGDYYIGPEDGSHDEGFLEAFVYAVGGVRSRVQIYDFFQLGINFKVYGSFLSIKRFKTLGENVGNHHPIFGGEVGVPFIFVLGKAKRWDIQVEPYYFQVDFSEIQNWYGFRVLAEVRF